jgi:hypothetical protein
MEGFKKIVVLQSFDEAEVMGIVLKQCGIPHRIRSYHDSALDGIFQITKGWGHVEAPEEYRDQIKEIHAGLPGEPSRDGKIVLENECDGEADEEAANEADDKEDA